MTGPGFYERAMLTIELPPGWFVSASTGQRQVQIMSLKFTHEAADLVRGRHSVVLSRTDQVLIDRADHRCSKICRRQVKVRVSGRTIGVDCVQLAGAGSQTLEKLCVGWTADEASAIVDQGSPIILAKSFREQSAHAQFLLPS